MSVKVIKVDVVITCECGGDLVLSQKDGRIIVKPCNARGNYHQHYVSGGQIVHIADTPMSVKGIIINMEVNNGQSTGVEASK